MSCLLLLLVALMLALPAAAVPAAPAESPPLRKAATVTLEPAGRGFNDYLIADPMEHRLYAGYASANALVAIDTQTNGVVGQVRDLRSVRGVAIVPELGLGFTSNRSEDTIGVVRLKNMELLNKIPGGRGPDAIIYDAAVQLVYVGDHEGHTGVLIDPASLKVVATITLGGSAEYAVADPVTGMIYQNLADVSQVAVIDPRERHVLRHFRLGDGHGPTGLALDPERHRLFVACSNNKLLVLDENDGRVVTTLPIGGNVDFVAYDAGFRRIYVPSGEGKITVILQEDADHYRVLANVATGRSTPRLAVDPTSHRVYAVASTGGRAEILVYEAVR